MKITITNSHIKAARLSKGKISPVELALNDLDCFEEVFLSQDGDGSFDLKLDGNPVKLPKSVQQLLWQFAETGEMEVISFELPVENNHFFSEEGLLFEPTDDDFSFGF